MASGLLKAQSAPPTLFFTDLVSGPSSGGEPVSGFAGAYVTIYGNSFGATQGSSTVTLNGSSCLRVVSWGVPWLWYQKIVVQLGSTCSSGSLSVTTTSGASNNLPFTVTAGNIYFASPSGSDSNTGTSANPFQTITKCKNAVGPGGICYVENGANDTGTENYSASVVLGTACTNSSPCALVAYPGASSTIGNNSNTRGLLACANLNGCSNAAYWVVAGFTLQGSQMGADIDGVSNHRLVGNVITCPNVGDGTEAGCLQTEAGANFVTMYGNEVKNVGAGGKLYHWVYLGADGHDLTFGWNSVHDANPSSGDGRGGCRGVQIYNGSGNSYNISVHDNTVYNIRCDGLNPQSVDPTQGFVYIYNNVVYHVGTGPDPDGALANYACLFLGGSGSGALVYQNTFYDCGSRGGSSSGILTPSISMTSYNNIAVAVGSEQYVSGTGSASSLLGSKNLWSGAGSGPSQTSGNVNADPLFVSASSANFHLQSSSPAIGVGSILQLTPYDHDGLPRSNPPSIGAYEFQSGSATKPNAPTIISIVVQ